MSTKTCSYRYDTLEKREQSKELRRLHRQALTFLESERKHWSRVGIVPGRTVLDIGCGSGLITNELARQVYPSQVVGLDISQALLDKGQQEYSENGLGDTSSEKRPQPVFKQGDIYNLPFEHNSFDVAYARLLFQHLDDPIKAVKSIWSVLKPGGLLCIVDIDKGWSGLYPEPETSLELDSAMIQKQLSQGGDPWVGRKLGYYLNSGGFKRVETNVTLIDSDKIGLTNFFGFLSFGEPHQLEKSKFSELQQKARIDVQKLISSPYAWAGFGLFVATGCKLP